MRPADSSSGEESADATAACAICLQNGPRLSIEHGAEVPGRVAVLAGCDVHAERSTPAYLVEADEVVGADRLFEPAYAVISEAMRKFDGLRHRVGAIGVHKKLTVRADGLPRGVDARRVLVRLGHARRLSHGR